MSNKPFRNLLNSLINKHQVLIAAHRGTSSGDIIENTVDAMLTAFNSGADIAELDVIRSTDNVYYVLHDGMEIRLIKDCGNLGTLSSREIEQLEYFNSSLVPSGQIERLDTVLKALKGTKLINLDRSERYWSSGFLDFIAQFDMFEQIIIKSSASSYDNLDKLESSNYKYMFMPIITKIAEWNKIKKRNLNLIGAEILFSDINSEFLTKDFQQEIHDNGLLLWANAICLGRSIFNLTAFKDDRSAILDNPDENWGWLIDHGFRLLQTDFPAQLYSYLATRYPDTRPPLFQSNITEKEWIPPSFIN